MLTKQVLIWKTKAQNQKKEGKRQKYILEQPVGRNLNKNGLK